MRTYSAEFTHDYPSYAFGYCNYARREAGDTLADIYAAGYLPYSGSARERGVFYMARSARIPLEHFELTSENRRIAKRHDGVFERRAIPLHEFDIKDERFLSFCLDYFAKRHGPSVMPSERLEFILADNLISHIITYTKNGTPLAYVLEVSDDRMTHFWYSFYDLEYINQSLGLWLMLDSARAAKAAGKRHLYLGTAYGEKGLYKTNFDPLEYWDGATWIADSKALRTLCRKDSDTK